MVFAACLIGFFIVGRLFFIPFKRIFKLIINSIFGGVLIYIINFFGAVFNFHIGLNIGTSIFVGLLGTPGVILLIIIQVFIS